MFSLRHLTSFSWMLRCSKCGHRAADLAGSVGARSCVASDCAPRLIGIRLTSWTDDYDDKYCLATSSYIVLSELSLSEDIGTIYCSSLTAQPDQTLVDPSYPEKTSQESWSKLTIPIALSYRHMTIRYRHPVWHLIKLGARFAGRGLPDARQIAFHWSG